MLSNNTRWTASSAQERSILGDSREELLTLAGLILGAKGYFYYNEYDKLKRQNCDGQDFRWQISRQDIIDGNFILTRVFLMNQDRLTPYPARTDSCGIFVLSLFGLKGAAMVVLMLVASLISLVIGSILLYLSDSPIKKSSPRIDYGLYGLAGILLIGMIANLLGWWIFAGLILLLAVLLTSIVITEMLKLRV